MNTRITIKMVGGAEVVFEDNASPNNNEEYTVIANEILKTLPAGSVYYVDNDDTAGTYPSGGGMRIKRWIQIFNGEYIIYAKIEEL